MNTLRRSAWLGFLPALAVCSGDTSTGTIETPPPGAVTDLVVSGTDITSAALTFTQVDDGAGNAANYELRYALRPISWGSASSTASGTCATPLHGTGVGSSLSCTILGLSAGTDYDFQVVAFRGTLISAAVFGEPSNIASAATQTPPPPLPPPPPPPPPVVTTVTVSPTSASVVVGATTALSATVKDAQGNVMTGQTIVWSTSNAAVATVSSSGVVTGAGAGAATITATCVGKTGTSAVTVTSPPPPAPVVTTVTVAPSAPSIVAGATVALTATVKDAQGAVMTGQTVTWTTSNPAAATVSSNGVVTGVAAGSATIAATCSGKTGTSAVTVTAPPPPPPPGGTVLFQEDFENASLASRGWYDNTGAVLSTTEHIAGSVSSAQYRFPAGATTPTSGGAQRHKFTPTSSFYLSYYVKYSANWVGSNHPYHPHEFQVMSTLDGDYDGPSNGFMVLYIEQSYQSGGKPRLGMQDNRSVNYSYGALPNNLVGVTENRSTGGCNGMSESNMAWECYDAGGYWYNLKQLLGPVVFQPNAGLGYKNNWNFVEAYFQLNTIVNGVGRADGVLQYWFNGALILDRHDILYRTGAHPTLQFNQFLIAPYIGDGSPVDQSMFIDNLRVGTAPVP